MLEFAVPSQTIVKIVPYLIRDGEYRHPWIQVVGTDINPNLAEAAGLDDTRGFMVISVATDGPAQKAVTVYCDTGWILYCCWTLQFHHKRLKSPSGSGKTGMQIPDIMTPGEYWCNSNTFGALHESPDQRCMYLYCDDFAMCNHKVLQ